MTVHLQCVFETLSVQKNPLLCCRERVRREVFKGQDAKGAHRTGSEGAALTVLAYAAVSCGAYLASPGIATGFLLGELGLVLISSSA